MDIKLITTKTEEQIHKLARLAYEIWNEYYIRLLSQQQIDYMLDRFQSVQAITEQLKQGYHYFFIQQERDIVGYAAVKQEGESLFLSKLYIKKEARGQGFGKAALQLITKMAAERQFCKIWLTVNRHNASSIAMYERIGFDIVNEQVADIGNGYVMDDYIMELTIS